MVAATIESPVWAQLAEHERKELLRFVVVGSVDDGKSTLIGRLLFEGQGLYEDQIAAVRRATRQEGQELDFSLFTDGLRAEREQGITIDVAYRYFSTAKRKFIIADTPGHTQYTRNMATGASTADVAIILIDARLGVLAQTRRHAYLAALLGIPRLAVAINKMDLVGFDRGVFESTSQALASFVGPLGFTDVSYFPISATAGDNVATGGARSPWYAGPTILEFLEAVPVGGNASQRPLRFPVQLVLRPHLDYRGFAGQITSGELRVGDEVLALPSRARSRIRAIDTFEGSRQHAAAPESVSLQLEDDIDLSRGEMLVAANDPARLANRLDATLVWLGTRPLDLGRELVLKHTTRRVKARVAEIVGKLDLETLEHVPASGLSMNDIARVKVTCHQPLFVDDYSDDRATGAFILVDALTNDTVAAGMISGASMDADGRGPGVTALERRQRSGHGGAVVCVLPADLEASERTLFDRGCAVVQVDNADAARSCARAGLLALIVSTNAGRDADWFFPSPDGDLVRELAVAGILDGSI